MGVERGRRTGVGGPSTPLLEGKRQRRLLPAHRAVSVGPSALPLCCPATASFSKVLVRCCAFAFPDLPDSKPAPLLCTKDQMSSSQNVAEILSAVGSKLRQDFDRGRTRGKESPPPHAKREGMGGGGGGGRGGGD